MNIYFLSNNNFMFNFISHLGWVILQWLHEITFMFAVIKLSEKG